VLIALPIMLGTAVALRVAHVAFSVLKSAHDNVFGEQEPEDVSPHLD